MTCDEASVPLNEALDRLVAEDLQLLTLGICERAVQFRLAHYMALSERIERTLTIDCEYNRHLGEPKVLPLPPRRHLTGAPIPSGVVPDILVHERNCDARNLLVVEIKRPGQSLTRDTQKLREFVARLHYRNAAHVVIGYDRSGRLVREIIWVSVEP